MACGLIRKYRCFMRTVTVLSRAERTRAGVAQALLAYVALYRSALECFYSMLLLSCGNWDSGGVEDEEGVKRAEEEGKGESVTSCVAEPVAHTGVRRECMKQLGKFLPAEIIRELGAMFDDVELCCVMDAFLEAENSRQLRSARRRYVTEARARARAVINLCDKGIPMLVTYVDIYVEGNSPNVAPWEVEEVGAKLSEIREKMPNRELEWSWDMLEQAGYDDNWECDAVPSEDGDL